MGDGPPVYLDSAATTLRPQPVIDAMVHHWQSSTGNVGRGTHFLSERASAAFDSARERIAEFINADPSEIIFVSNSTEAINLVANGLAPCRTIYGVGEHHSNLLPWRREGSVPCPSLGDGCLDLLELERLLRRGVDVVAVASISNAFGAVNDVRRVVELAHRSNSLAFIDASQTIPHARVDVTDWDCDFLCFSGHKMCGPMGIGVLYARSDVLDRIRPIRAGGGSVKTVEFDSFEWLSGNLKHESGTPNVEGAVGLAAACSYLETIGMNQIEQHVQTLANETAINLSQIPGIQLLGPPAGSPRGAIVSWTCRGVDSHTIARVLSKRHRICVRSGYHCAQPAHMAIGAQPSLRASFYFYNTRDESRKLCEAIQQIVDYA